MPAGRDHFSRPFATTWRNRAKTLKSFSFPHINIRAKTFTASYQVQNHWAVEQKRNAAAWLGAPANDPVSQILSSRQIAENLSISTLEVALWALGISRIGRTLLAAAELGSDWIAANSGNSILSLARKPVRELFFAILCGTIFAYEKTNSKT